MQFERRVFVEAKNVSIENNIRLNDKKYIPATSFLVAIYDRPRPGCRFFSFYFKVKMTSSCWETVKKFCFYWQAKPKYQGLINMFNKNNFSEHSHQKILIGSIFSIPPNILIKLFINLLSLRD